LFFGKRSTRVAFWNAADSSSTSE